MALFGQRKDVIEEIDQHLINRVRESDLEALQKLASDGYDKILTEFQVVWALLLYLLCN